MRRISGTSFFVAFLTFGGCSPAGAQRPQPPAPVTTGTPTVPVAGQLAQVQEKPATIEVTGTASVKVAPDRALVSLAVETQEKTAAAASRTNATAMSAVLAALRAGGFTGLDIDTYGYVLSPVYTSLVQDGSRVQHIDGYRALNNVRATLTDMTSVGRLIDVATGAGANRVSGISFEASDLESAQGQALSEAVRRARAQARTIAEALDRVLGAPLEVRGGAEQPSPRMYARAAASMVSEAATPIEAGDQTVSANVTIIFALGPEQASR